MFNIFFSLFQDAFASIQDVISFVQDRFCDAAINRYEFKTTTTMDNEERNRLISFLHGLHMNQSDKLSCLARAGCFISAQQIRRIPKLWDYAGVNTSPT